MLSKHLHRLTAAAFVCALVVPFAACEMQEEEFVDTPEAQEPFPADTMMPGMQPGMQPGTQPGMTPGTQPDTGMMPPANTEAPTTGGTMEQ